MSLFIKLNFDSVAVEVYQLPCQQCDSIDDK